MEIRFKKGFGKASYRPDLRTNDPNWSASTFMQCFIKSDLYDLLECDMKGSGGCALD